MSTLMFWELIGAVIILKRSKIVYKKSWIDVLIVPKILRIFATVFKKSSMILKDPSMMS